MFVFDKPPFEDWHHVLRRHGHVVETIGSTNDIVIASSLAGVQQAAGLEIPRRFFPLDTQFTCLSSYGAFGLLMDRLSPQIGDLMPRRWHPDRDGYPCVAHADSSIAGSGVRILRHKGDRKPTDVTPYVHFRELVHGRTEYVQHVAVFRGEILKTITYKVTLPASDSVKRGALPTTRVDDNLQLSRFYGEIGYTGFACANYKLASDGPKLFEINPRMGGSLVRSSDLLGMLDVVNKLDWH